MPTNLDLTPKESHYLESILSTFIAEHNSDTGSSTHVYYAKTILGHMYHLKEVNSSKEPTNG